mmetsp:Transcript_2778/g.7643  ORF Transcript_2778/g.7643 Transcript_2778/m.7643 type:complete len:271 (-) Transcript_2778:56-868(-)
MEMRREQDQRRQQRHKRCWVQEHGAWVQRSRRHRVEPLAHRRGRRAARQLNMIRRGGGREPRRKRDRLAQPVITEAERRALVCVAERDRHREQRQRRAVVRCDCRERCGGRDEEAHSDGECGVTRLPRAAKQVHHRLALVRVDAGVTVEHVVAQIEPRDHANRGEHQLRQHRHVHRPRATVRRARAHQHRAHRDSVHRHLDRLRPQPPPLLLLHRRSVLLPSPHLHLRASHVSSRHPSHLGLRLLPHARTHARTHRRAREQHTRYNQARA